MRVALVCPYSLSRPGGVQGQVVGPGPRPRRAAVTAVTVFAPFDAAPARPPGSPWCPPAGRSPAGQRVGRPGDHLASCRAAGRPGRAVTRCRRGPRPRTLRPRPGLRSAGRRKDAACRGDLPPQRGECPLHTAAPVGRLAARRVAARCAVSEAAAATASRALPGPYEVLFNGVEVDRYRRVEPWPTTGPTVLFLGRHEERKGLRVLLEALAASPGTAVRCSRTPQRRSSGSPGTGRRPPPSGGVIPSRALLQWLGVLPEEEKLQRLAARTCWPPRRSGASPSGWCSSRPWPPERWSWLATSRGIGRRAGGVRCSCHRGTPAPWPRPSPACSTAASLHPRRPGAAVGSPLDRGAWLDRGSERAEQWSMEALAGRYEGIYRAVMVGAGC